MPVKTPAYEPGSMWPPAGWPEYFFASEWNCWDHRGLMGRRGALVGDVTSPETPRQVYEAIRRCAWNLQRVREIVGPLRVSSGWRPTTFNEALYWDSYRRNNGKPGVARYSEHITGRAADVVPLEPGVSVRHLHRVFSDLIKQGRIDDGGLGRYPGWVHYDCRAAYGFAPARW